MRIALYGGSFDPVHHGHLILARDAIELLDLERVIFIPASHSPHKPGRPPAPAASRRDMLAAAIAGEPRFELDESELQRPAPSYSVDTVEQIHARYPGAKLFYLIGYDNLAKLHTWRRIDTLRSLVEFVVFDRGRQTPSAAAGVTPDNLKSLGRRVDISATEIRQRVADGLSIRYLVPEALISIINRDALYAAAGS